VDTDGAVTSAGAAHRPAPGAAPEAAVLDGALVGPDGVDAVHSGGAHVDVARAEAAVREFLLAIGEDPHREGLVDTPSRVARAAVEMFAGLRQDAAQTLARTFEIDHDELVIVRDIPMYSVCEHHLLPFHGEAHIGYIPSHDGIVTGLSKLARLVDVFARRPQVQERITTQIADSLVTHLQAQGVIVVIEAEHLCMSMRGVRKPGSRTITSAVRGQLRSPATRAEAMSLLLGGKRG
jgi:GTP cyclohydrolase IA